MKLKILLVMFFSQSLICELYSQVTEEWVRRYTASRSAMQDEGHSIAVDGSGNVYVTGKSWFPEQPGGLGLGHCVTLKYNSSGVFLWVQIFNAYSAGSSIAVDALGNVYVGGNYYTSQSNGSDFLTIKYNSSGVQQWAKFYNGSASGGFDDVHNIAVDGSGNVIVTGRSEGAGTGADFATVKYSPVGFVLWEKRYNGPGNDWDYSLDMTLDSWNNVYVTGVSIGIGTYYDALTIKYLSSGTEAWVERFNGSPGGYDGCNSIAVDGLGNVYVGGGTDGTDGTDFLTIKYNSFGIQLWHKEYDYSNSEIGGDESRGLVLDGSGNVYVTGWSEAGGHFDYATLKYNSLGTMLWLRRYNGPGNGADWPNQITADGSGNVYVTGYSWGNGTNIDCTTIRYNSGGGQEWVQRYNGPDNGGDEGYDIATDGTGNVYVTGYCHGIGTHMDFVTIKYFQGGDNITLSNTPREFKLYNNYPNPFNPSTNIEFAIPKSSFVKLAVYDMLGREVETLINQELNAGTYNAAWDAVEYSSGVYFYKLETDGFIETKKMMLIK